jgi:uncharacterized repeat protein (TIGR01451 family)
VTCTHPGPLGIGASLPPITLTVVANTPIGSPFTNTATASTPGNSNPAASTGSDIVTVEAPDLSITKTDGGTTAIPGGTVLYTLTYSNLGTIGSTGVRLTETVPVNTAFVPGASTPGWSCVPDNSAGSACTLNVGAVAAGAGGTAAFTVAVAISLPAGGAQVTNMAVIADDGASGPDGNPANDSSTVTTTIVDSADLAVTKTGPPTVTPGMTVTYTVDLTNNGPSGAQNVSLTDNVPGGTTFVSMTQTAGPAFACTGANCTIANLASSATATFNIVLQVLSSEANGSSIVNTANVSSSTGDPAPGNNSATASSTATTSADLAVTKSGPATVASGTNITYNLTVSNSGPSDASAVTLSDPFPAGSTFVSSSQTAGPTFACTNPPVGSGGTVSCTISTFGAGMSAGFSITLHTPSSLAAGATLTNTANVSSTTTDPDPTNSSASTTATVSPEADLSVSKSGSPPSVVSGSNITYTISVTNNGPSDSSSVSFSDVVPANTTLVSQSQTAGPAFTCSTPPAGGTGTTTCTIATLPNGLGATFSIVVNVDAGASAGTITNTANVTSATPDANAGNDSASATTAVTTSAPSTADVSIVKSANSGAVGTLGAITYTIVVANSGPASATGVTVTDNIPAGTSFLSAVPSQGTCTGTASVNCSIGAIASAGTAIVTLTIAAPATPGVITNSATVTSSSSDSNAANNTSSAAVIVSTGIPALHPEILALLAIAFAALGFFALRK